MRDEPVKDAAQDLTQDVAEDLTGAAKDGSVKVFIVAGAIFSTAPHASLGRYVKEELVKDAAQGVAEGVAEGVP